MMPFVHFLVSAPLALPTPSFKLFTLKISGKQLASMISHPDSPVRDYM